MHFSEDHLSILATIQTEWNRAEADIKTAEMVVRKIVLPSVKELRYAGRRIIDVLMVITANPDDPNHAQIGALLEDARFDCHRARHDAIDAATAKIAADLEIMAEKLGYHAILPAYPEFPKLYQSLLTVRDKIKESREKRDNREAIYSVIEAVDFPALVPSFNTMRASEPIMVQLAKKSRRDRFFGEYGLYIGLGALVVGAIALIVSLVR
jgi:hypothetical protein